MNIITLTLNPAMDVHCRMDHFLPYHENLADIISRDCGGKGINISRALYANGISSMPVILIGEESRSEFQTGLSEKLPDPFWIGASGRVRENITLHSEEGETRISFRGFQAPLDTLQQVSHLLESVPVQNTILTFTGSLPVGICSEDAVSFLIKLREKGIKLVIDSKSISLEQLYQIKPWLIKPNAEEIQAYFQEEPTVESLTQKALQLYHAGIEHVMVSLGADGALYCTKHTVYHAEVPKVAAVSTIGAGDSTIAGFLAASCYPKNFPFTAASAESEKISNTVFEPQHILRTAVSYGTAACLTEGTMPPLPEDIASIYQNVKIKIVQ